MSEVLPDNVDVAEQPEVRPDTMPRLKRRYREELAGSLREQLGIANVMRLPSLDKIVVNIGLGEAVGDSRALEGAQADLAVITGQKPRVNRARRSIANFKLREGMPIGVKVTLRGDRMWEFFDRLLSIALPRVRDFRGLKANAFDGHGNYTFGLTEQLMFPEIDYDQIDAVRGMDITIVTTSDDDSHARALLSAYGFPFTRTEES